MHLNTYPDTTHKPYSLCVIQYKNQNTQQAYTAKCFLFQKYRTSICLLHVSYHCGLGGLGFRVEVRSGALKYILKHEIIPMYKIIQF